MSIRLAVSLTRYSNAAARSSVLASTATELSRRLAGNHHHTNISNNHSRGFYIPASHNRITPSTVTGRSFSSSSPTPDNTPNTTTAAPPVTWVESKHIPDNIRPYLYLARMDKPVGTLLLLWPCTWGVALATPQLGLELLPSLSAAVLMGKFALGAFIMRGAGCTINDMWDQDFDKKVARTKQRPLASGALTTTDAFKFLFMQLSAGLAVLLTFNETSIITGFAAMPLVVVYPLMKRYTYWPQFVLGLTFNWGVWVGYSAIFDSINYMACAPLYGAGVCWTLIYDTIYGYQDRTDDAKIGVKSVPLYLGDKPQWPLTGISAGMLGGLLLAGYQADLSLPYYLGTTGIMSHIWYQIWTADIDNPKNLWDRFSSNIYTGAAVTAAIVAGHF